MLEFIRAEAGFYLQHAQKARALDEVAKNTNEITLKCEKLVELEELAKKLAPPSEERLKYFASQIGSYVDMIEQHNLHLKPTAPMHTKLRAEREQYAKVEAEIALANTPEKVRAREAVDAEIRALEAFVNQEHIQELMDDMCFSVIRSNVNLPFASQMKIHVKPHHTVAAHAAYIKFNAKSAVDKRKDELAAYNTKYARVHMFKDAAALAKLTRNADTIAAAITHLAAAIREVNTECPICMAAGPDCATRCRHAFHRRCIATWLGAGNSTCPLCRAGIAERELTDRI